MTIELTGQCVLIPVDKREYTYLRELLAGVQVSGEPQSDAVKEIVKKLMEEWK